MTQSLRDRLEAKRLRRTDVLVQVSDPGPDALRAATAGAVLLAAQADPARAGELEDLRAAHAAAMQDVSGHYERVAFQALPPADFEALVAAHTADGNVDSDALLPVLAAECAVDEDLRDAAWWAAQLDPTTGAWTSGERDELYGELFVRLNYSAPAGDLPKG